MSLLKTICWVIIFKPRLYFPPGTSVTMSLVNRYNNGSLAVFHKYQHTELNLTFLKKKKCKQHYAVPVFFLTSNSPIDTYRTPVHTTSVRHLLDEETANK